MTTVPRKTWRRTLKVLKTSLFHLKPSAPPKKIRSDENESTETNTERGSNATILATINSLQNTMVDFERELKQNTLTITNITKAMEFNSAEIKDCKE